jgi:hypothetical protein
MQFTVRTIGLPYVLTRMPDFPDTQTMQRARFLT